MIKLKKIRFVLIAFFAILGNMNAQETLTEVSLNQADSRIYVEISHSKTVGLGFQWVNIHITNNTSDVLRVKINYTAIGSSGNSETKSIGGVLNGTMSYLDIKPGQRIGGDQNDCQMQFYGKCKGKEIKVDGGISCIQNVSYKIISIVNLSEQERNEAKEKANKEKALAQNNAATKQVAEAKVIKEESIKNQEKESTQKNIDQQKEKEQKDLESKNTQAYINQQEQERIDENKKAQEEYQKAKEKADNDNEIRKKEYADQVIRETKAKNERDKALVSETSKTAGDFVSSVLSEKGSTFGVLYGISPANADFYGITMGNKSKFYNYGNFGASFGKSTQFFTSIEFGRFSLLRLIPNSKELNEIVIITPSIGYYSIQPNLGGEEPENVGQTFNYDAIQLGASLIINLEASFFARFNYSTDVSYFKGISQGTVGPVSGKSKPFNGAGYFNVGIGFGFGN